MRLASKMARLESSLDLLVSTQLMVNWASTRVMSVNTMDSLATLRGNLAKTLDLKESNLDWQPLDWECMGC